VQFGHFTAFIGTLEKQKGNLWSSGLPAYFPFFLSLFLMLEKIPVLLNLPILKLALSI